MDNSTFLEQLGVTDPERQQACLEAMEKYADNKWWEPDTDPRKYAYYQINEPILLGEFTHFHESIELLLSRPVYKHEFGLSTDKLKQEAYRAWTYQVGVTSEVERQERIAESMDEFEEWAKQNNKQIIQVNLPEDEQ